jgi:carboxyl-terminal processing protease
VEIAKRMFVSIQARTTVTRHLQVVLAACTVAGVAACGGGGGGSGGGQGLGSWQAIAAQCAAPRSGIDPYTGAAYPDRQGTLRSEQNWLAAWTSDTYLWYGDVTYPDPSGYATAIDYFNVLRSPVITASGRPKDQFHFTHPTAVWEALAQTGVQAGYGATWDLISAAPPRQTVVAYTEPNSPATTLAPPLARGAQVLFVDGVDLVNDNTQAGVNALNAGLFPASAGETHVFVVLDPGATASRSISMISANVASAPVQHVTTLPSTVPGAVVGYMLFNDHLATAEPALISAISQLKAAAVTDLVLDIRYNAGGYLDIASELAYMIAGPGPTTGRTFDSIRFNAKHPVIDPVAGTAIVPTPFHATTQGFTASPPAGQALPYLGLSRVFVLTGSNTCSASEAVINGLKGVGIQVIQIGATTCGKPYGFYPADNCGTTYFSIQFQGVNQMGFGNYPDGFVAQNGVTTGVDPGAVLPGCSVGDDFLHALGDPAEGRVAVALQYMTGASCPAPTGFAAPGRLSSLAATEGRVVKPAFLTNRIMRPRR